ncbi:MAG TPA: hypothetical protein VEW42_03830 [Candidatus Eisenbacteria bacterium]|nr:hypothetical protein [Candidatus Eisenbacteria bacterium]
MVQERSQRDNPKRSRQFGDHLKRGRKASRMDPFDAADAINNNGYPSNDPKDPVPPLGANDWRKLEDGTHLPTHGKRLTDAYRQAGIGGKNDGDINRDLARDILHDKLGDRADRLLDDLDKKDQ